MVKKTAEEMCSEVKEYQINRDKEKHWKEIARVTRKNEESRNRTAKRWEIH